MKTLSKLFEIYVFVFMTLIAIMIPLYYPFITILLYIDSGFGGLFFKSLLFTIISSPITIRLSYALLKTIKDSYSDRS